MKVCVVGCGVSGAAAAAELVEAGVQDVLVLEALDRPGGRVHTLPHGEAFFHIVLYNVEHIGYTPAVLGMLLLNMEHSCTVKNRVHSCTVKSLKCVLALSGVLLLKCLKKFIICTQMLLSFGRG